MRALVFILFILTVFGGLFNWDNEKAFAKKNKQGPIGVWVVEPSYFDKFSDEGLALPMFPVLVVKPGGRFVLYRVRNNCTFVFDKQGALILPFDEGLENAKVKCHKELKRAKSDGFNMDLHLSAEGRWTISSTGKIQFIASVTGPHPLYWKKKFQGIEKAKIRDLLKLKKANTENLKEIAKQIDFQVQFTKNFYTTSYILDGQEVMFTVENNHLLLGDRTTNRFILYRRYRTGSINSAARIIWGLELSMRHYFRCVLNAFEDVNNKSSELESLVEVITKFKNLKKELLVKKTRLDKKALVTYYRTSYLPRRDAIITEIRKNPVAKAAFEDRKLGTYLGCPDRD